jgi:hypothetical protein
VTQRGRSSGRYGRWRLAYVRAKRPSCRAAQIRAASQTRTPSADMTALTQMTVFTFCSYPLALAAKEAAQPAGAPAPISGTSSRSDRPDGRATLAPSGSHLAPRVRAAGRRFDVVTHFRNSNGKILSSFSVQISESVQVFTFEHLTDRYPNLYSLTLKGTRPC